MHQSFLPRLVAGVFALSSSLAWANAPALPGAGWTASRYETLWVKSPFAVSTPEAGLGSESSEYAVCGIAQIDGVSYASLTDKERNEHFHLSTDHPVRGFTLVSITRESGAFGASIVVQKDGQLITFKLDRGASALGNAGYDSRYAVHARQFKSTAYAQYGHELSVQSFPKTDGLAMEVTDSKVYLVGKTLLCLCA